MATASEIVNGAYRKLGIKPSDSAITAEEMNDGIETLNDMMMEFENSGISMGYSPVAGASDSVRIPRGAENAIKANLAGYLAADLHKQITPTLAAQIQLSTNNMLRLISKPFNVQFPDTLPTGSGNQCNGETFLDERFYSENDGENF